MGACVFVCDNLRKMAHILYIQRQRRKGRKKERERQGDWEIGRQTINKMVQQIVKYLLHNKKGTHSNVAHQMDDTLCDLIYNFVSLKRETDCCNGMRKRVDERLKCHRERAREKEMKRDRERRYSIIFGQLYTYQTVLSIFHRCVIYAYFNKMLLQAIACAKKNNNSINMNVCACDCECLCLIRLLRYFQAFQAQINCLSWSKHWI